MQCRPFQNLAHNFRSQIQKEAQVLKLVNSEASALDQETKRLQQQLGEILEHHERQQVNKPDSKFNIYEPLLIKQTFVLKLIEKVG